MIPFHDKILSSLPLIFSPLHFPSSLLSLLSPCPHTTHSQPSFIYPLPSPPLSLLSSHYHYPTPISSHLISSPLLSLLLPQALVASAPQLVPLLVSNLDDFDESGRTMACLCLTIAFERLRYTHYKHDTLLCNTPLLTFISTHHTPQHDE